MAPGPVGGPPMNPAIAGGAPPINPAVAGGVPPMNPAVAGGVQPMNPAVAGGPQVPYQPIGAPGVNVPGVWPGKMRKNDTN